MIRTRLVTFTLISALALTACGLADTAATTATVAASEAEQARQAQQTEKKVQQQVQAAQQLDADRRHAAETNDSN